VWLVRDPLASWLIGGTVVLLLASEAAVSYLGQARDGQRRPLGAVLEAVVATRRRDGTRSQDRWTLLAIVAGSRIGVFGAVAIAALVPAARVGANNWWTLGIGLAIALAGIALRDWAVFTLGRYFRRLVTIEPGQTLIRGGPYRWLRHPSYSGILLVCFGLGLAFGSWLGAIVACAGMLAGLLPRIRVEEAALRAAFGAEYEDYAAATSRFAPHLW
jgi:protein-S-isoprenylcysteine O-methyltransferase Ste14